MQERNNEPRPKIAGAQMGYVVQLDSGPQDMIMIGIFDNKDLYTKNADGNWTAVTRDRLSDLRTASPL